MFVCVSEKSVKSVPLALPVLFGSGNPRWISIREPTGQLHWRSQWHTPEEKTKITEKLPSNERTLLS